MMGVIEGSGVFPFKFSLIISLCTGANLFGVQTLWEVGTGWSVVSHRRKQLGDHLQEALARFEQVS